MLSIGFVIVKGIVIKHAHTFFVGSMNSGTVFIDWRDSRDVWFVKLREGKGTIVYRFDLNQIFEESGIPDTRLNRFAIIIFAPIFYSIGYMKGFLNAFVKRILNGSN